MSIVHVFINFLYLESGHGLGLVALAARHAANLVQAVHVQRLRLNVLLHARMTEIIYKVFKTDRARNKAISTTID